MAQHIHFTQPTVLEEGCLGLPEGEEWDHYKVERILFGLGFVEEDMAKPPSTFSGGFQIRLNLAKVLVSSPNLLLLDEPTNHLDMQSIEALIEGIKEFEGAVVIVTHSEMILREIPTRLVLFQHGTAEVFNGSYDDFLEKIGWEEEGEATRLR